MFSKFTFKVAWTAFAWAFPPTIWNHWVCSHMSSHLAALQEGVNEALPKYKSLDKLNLFFDLRPAFPLMPNSVPLCAQHFNLLSFSFPPPVFYHTHTHTHTHAHWGGDVSQDGCLSWTKVPYDSMSFMCMCVCRARPTGCAIGFGTVQLCYIQSAIEMVKVCKHTQAPPQHTHRRTHTQAPPELNISISLLNSSETLPITVQNNWKACGTELR